ncbi:LVIVD repeat-containing protein [Brevundimonas sp. NPDC092305]|uniref:LVIVD repeat-containing protein n=1 Tax=Brevundimonas sp. NPDC092305 TaxID=3363957 RepID=UPI003812FAE5
MIVRGILLSSVAALGLLGASMASAQTPAPDARTTLSPGLRDAGQAASNMTLVSSVAPPPGFFDPEALFRPSPPRPEGAPAPTPPATPPKYTPLALSNSDMAMSNGRLFVGNFNGFNAYDVREGEPKLVMSVVCPGGQGDLSIHGNLLFMSVEQNRGRLDCGTAAAEGDVNADRFRGVRIFDISNLNAPRQIAAVQTCRGSHTHTLVPDPRDRNVLYIYNSGTAGVRKTDELSICTDGEPDKNPETALYSIDVIKVPLDHPEQAAIVNRPRIFADRETGQVAGLWRGGRVGVASQDTSQTNQCHDITVYPEMNLAAGACAGNGILLDISDPQNPARISDLFDPDMAYWHSATFNNTADRIVFTDEWGGGIGARCRAEDPATWGANLIATVEDRTLKGQSFHKLPGIQGASENCVAHNGNVVPVPGRDLMVQAWYQGGVSVMDFTDPKKPVEIAYFDRGPIEPDRVAVGGSWSAYWLNGRIYSSEIARGLDVLKLEPSDQLSAAEIAAAESVMAETINPQTQTRIQWADSPDVAQAYLDQLTRSRGIDGALATQAGAAITGWRGGSADKAGAATVATSLKTAAGASTVAADKARLSSLAGVFERLAA